MAQCHPLAAPLSNSNNHHLGWQHLNLRRHLNNQGPAKGLNLKERKPLGSVAKTGSLNNPTASMDALARISQSHIHSATHDHSKQSYITGNPSILQSIQYPAAEYRNQSASLPNLSPNIQQEAPVTPRESPNTQRKLTPTTYPEQVHSSHQSSTTQPEEPPRPMAVDLNNVYNPYHKYQKEIEAADVERARISTLEGSNEAAEAATPVIRVPDAQHTQHNPLIGDLPKRTSLPSILTPKKAFSTPEMPTQRKEADNGKDVSGKPPTLVTDNESETTKDLTVAAMEEEMKVMVEKMRDYQNRDPKLFSQVWEAVKKVQSHTVMALVTSERSNANTSIPAAPKQVENTATARSSPTAPPTSQSTEPPTLKQVRPIKSIPAAGLAHKALVRAEILDAKEAIEGAVATGEVPLVATKPASEVQSQNGSRGNAVLSFTATQLVLSRGDTDPSITARLKSARQTMTPRFQKTTTVAASTPVLSLKHQQNLVSSVPAIKPSAKSEVIWPIANREVISTAAAGVLNSLPENLGKVILASHLSDMLDSNPTFVELCDLIERQGFKMDRARFAKTLLSAIPDNSHKSGLEPSTTIARAFCPPQTAIYSSPYQRSITLDKAQSSNPSALNVPSLSLGRGNHNSAPGYASVPPNSLRPQNSNSSEPPKHHRGRPMKNSVSPPVSKSQAPGSTSTSAAFTQYISPYQTLTPSGALPTSQSYISILPPKYKSQFAAPVTIPVTGALSNGHSNIAHLIQRTNPTQQQGLNSTPPANFAMVRKRNIMELLGESSEDGPVSNNGGPSKVRRLGKALREFGEEQRSGHRLPKSSTSTTFKHFQSKPVTTVAGLPGTGVVSYELAVSKNPPANPFKYFQEIIQPISRRVTLRKAKYNAKTIASHVLIATSRHPTQRGLNAHLEPLKASFSRVDNSSDLSTFRWDIVDPDRLPVGSANIYADKKAKSATSDMDPLSSIMPDRSVFAGRGQPPPIREGSYLGGRGQGKRRGRPPGSKIVNGKLSLSGLPKEVITISSGDDEMEVDQNTQDSALFPPILASTQGSITQNEDPWKAGRPSKPLVSSTSDSPAANLGKLADKPSILLSTGKRRGRPPRNPNVPSPSVTGSFASSAPKRRGRPPKAVLNVTGASNAHAHAKTSSDIPKPRGRPRKLPLEDRLAKIPVKEPQFMTFHCEWEGCKAELHNLETLKVHIFKVHGRNKKNFTDTDAIQCMWASCSLKEPSSNVPRSQYPSLQPQIKRLVFPNSTAFETHVQIAHLEPFAWHLGDGPRGSTLEPSRPDLSYLLDERGRQVTPSVEGQSVSSGRARVFNQQRVEDMDNDLPSVMRTWFLPVDENMRGRFLGPMKVMNQVPDDDPIEEILKSRKLEGMETKMNVSDPEAESAYDDEINGGEQEMEGVKEKEHKEDDDEYDEEEDGEEDEEVEMSVSVHKLGVKA